jgi:putative phage-type endonuclease
MLSERDIKIRATGIGSSEISAIVGENLFANAHDVWLAKLGLVEPMVETDAMWLGHQLEPVIARRYIKETGVRLRRGHGTRRHSQNPWQVCTTDFHFAKTDEQRIVECKLVGMRVMHHWTLDADGAPPYVLTQAHWQMGVLGLSRCDVAVIFGGTAEFRIYQITFDSEVFAMLTEIGRKFWFDRVVARVPPPIDETDSARRSLLAIYGYNRAPLKDAPPEAQQWVDARMDADARLKAAEKEKDLATNKLCEIIGEAEGIRTEDWYATWKLTKAGTRAFRLAEWKKGRRAA